MAKYNYDKYRTGAAWKYPIVLDFPDKQGYDDYVLRLEVNSSTSVYVGSIVEAVQDGGTETDLYKVTVASDESVRPQFVVIDSEHNKEQLATDNSKDSCDDTNTPRGSTYYTAATKIDTLILTPGMITNTPVTATTTCYIGANMIAGGSGKVKPFDESTPDAYSAKIGSTLTNLTTTDDLQWIALKHGGI